MGRGGLGWLRVWASLGSLSKYGRFFLSPFESRRPWPKRSAFQILQAGLRQQRQQRLACPPPPRPLLLLPVAHLSTLLTSEPELSEPAGSLAPRGRSLGPWLEDTLTLSACLLPPLTPPKAPIFN